MVLKGEVERLGFNVLLAPDQPPDSAYTGGHDFEQGHRWPECGGVKRPAGPDSADRQSSVLLQSIALHQHPRGHDGSSLRRHSRWTYSRAICWPRPRCSLSCSFRSLQSSAPYFSRCAMPQTTAPRPLIAAGSAYFSLIGMGFMFAEISLLQYFSVYLGHPIYSLSVCLFQPDPGHRPWQPGFGPAQHRLSARHGDMGPAGCHLPAVPSTVANRHIPRNDGARVAGAHFYLAGRGCPLGLPSGICLPYGDEIGRVR